jgi:hypothetical protein
MPIILTISVSNPLVEASKGTLLNSISNTLNLIGPEWSHLTTHAEEGRVEVNFQLTPYEVSDYATCMLRGSGKFSSYSGDFP